MSPKKPSISSETGSQGMLFDEQIVHNSFNDPSSSEPKHVLVPVEGGTFQPELTAVQEHDFSDPVILEAVHKENVRRKNSEAQRGLHSALDPETGLYDLDKIAPGVVLPDYGIVKYGNQDEARKFAKGLNELILESRK